MGNGEPLTRGPVAILIAFTQRVYNWVRAHPPKRSDVDVQSRVSQLSKAKQWTPWKIFQNQFKDFAKDAAALQARFPGLDPTAPWAAQASEAYRTLGEAEKAALVDECRARNEQLDREVPRTEQQRRMYVAKCCCLRARADRRAAGPLRSCSTPTRLWTTSMRAPAGQRFSSCVGLTRTRK